ncbi:bis(5'-nucleosyl)-tetraphosphatase (symmetrical) YqeK [Acetobacterium woodii]|nr:bis(5'-nucleosyl)-tetraphosphatase (symmetrical) YqeK [Acetobacterium woodii]
MNRTEIEADLKKKLSAKRFRHTQNVVEAASNLAYIYGCNVDQVSLAALLHDCAKYFSDQQLLQYAKKHHLKVDRVSRYNQQLLHGPVGAIVAKQTYGVEDVAILHAICYHTTGCKEMTTLDEIIYLADYIEKDRSFPGIEDIRKMADTNLDLATIMALTNSICYVASVGDLIHKRTIDARNDLIIKNKKRK